MSSAALPHSPGREGLRWLAVIWLCLLAGPIFGTMAEYSRYADSDVSATFWQLAFMSLVLCPVGFLLGPILATWSVYIGISLLTLGLSDEHVKFVLCSSKDWFESDLASLSLALMFPASAVATYILFSRLVLKRAAQSKHIGILFIACAAASQGMLWYYHYLEREVSRYGIC